MIDFGLGKLRLWSAAAACAGLFMTQAAGTHLAAFTLNDVMQAPFPSYMLAAPTGAAVAWVFNAKGCSNIWVADPSHGAKARQITPYTEDDGYRRTRLVAGYEVDQGSKTNAVLRPAFVVTNSTSRFK
ncbi:MAG TPA: hypothetical protein VJO16_04250 [Candidatus Acidoferrum sp.]|nr:hypothetical protein [Candidatus Acidoferrum sp.]